MEKLISKHNKKLALELLEETAKYLDSINTEQRFAIELARDASILLGFKKLSKHFTKRLKAINYHPLKGAITNIPDKSLPKSAFKIPISTKKQIKLRYPEFSEDYLKKINSRYSDYDHISLCLEGKFEEGFQAAGNISSKNNRELFKLEAASTMALAGNPLLAYKMCEQLIRKDELTTVLIIEFIRNGRHTIAKRLLEKMKANQNFYLFDGSRIAIGITNHIPWEIYPFPDY